jgi:hypothetical protein
MTLIESCVLLVLAFAVIGVLTGVWCEARRERREDEL